MSVTEFAQNYVFVFLFSASTIINYYNFFLLTPYLQDMLILLNYTKNLLNKYTNLRRLPNRVVDIITLLPGNYMINLSPTLNLPRSTLETSWLSSTVSSSSLVLRLSSLRPSLSGARLGPRGPPNCLGGKSVTRSSAVSGV